MNKPSISLAWRLGARRDSSAFGRVERVADFRTLRLELYGLILLVDALAIVSSFLLADLVRYRGHLHGYGIATFTIVFPMYLAVALNGDAWSIESLQSARHSAGSATRAFLYAIAVTTVLFFAVKAGANFSRLVFAMGSGISLSLIAAERFLIGKALGRRYGWSFRREVLILDGLTAQRAGDEIVVDAAIEGLSPASNDPVALDRLAQVLGRSERAIVACAPERRQVWARALAGANLDVEILVPELSALPAIGLRRHGSTPAVLVGCGPLPLRSRALKRFLDASVAAGSLLLLAPLLVLIVAAIWLESRGPVLFRQKRMGRANRLFNILKFRTMRADAVDHSGARSASPHDDRVTRVGRLLRRTSLDELPQLINVLKGEMSIVGPRPHALGTSAESELLWTIDERYFDRHAIKPGMTGLAQVRGFRGATARRSDVTDRLRADLEYIDGWHIGRDFAIMLRTIGVLIHPNAF